MKSYIFLMPTIFSIIFRSSSGSSLLFGAHASSQKNRFTIICLPSVWHSMPFTRMTDKLEQIGSMFARKFSMNTTLFIFASNSNVFNVFSDSCGWHSIFGNFDSHRVNVSFLWEKNVLKLEIRSEFVLARRLTDSKQLVSLRCHTANWILSKRCLLKICPCRRTK